MNAVQDHAGTQHPLPISSENQILEGQGTILGSLVFPINKGVTVS